MKSIYSVAAGTCLVLLSVAAQAELGPIVITPTRTEQPTNNSSATVYVITEEQIEKSGVVTTSELLRGVPGVQLTDLFGNGNEVTVSVRGFSATANANTLVLVNGRRLNYSDTATPDLHHINPQDIAQIEVLVGSAGSLYGDQAVGGVVNIITKRSVENYHQVRARVGSFAYNGVEFSSSRQISETLGYRLSAESFEADHYRDNNAQEKTSFSGLLEYQKNENQLFLEMQETRDDQELPGALLEDEFEDDPTQVNPGFVNDFRDEDISVLRVGYARDFGNHRFSIDATQRETDADIRQSLRDFPSIEDGFDERKNKSINPKLSGVIVAGIDIPYVVGIDVEEIDYELEIPFESAFGSGEIASSNEQDVENIYFQVNPQLTEMTQLTFGMRHASVDNDFTDGFSFPDGEKTDDDITVAELGLAYRLNNRTRLTARYDQNFRFAKVNELAGGPTDEILDNQTGESFEFGIDVVSGNHQVVASLYRLDLEDEIEFDPTPTATNPFGSNVNLDDTRRNGFTVALLSQVTDNFVMKAEVGYVDAEFRSGVYNGNKISGVSDKIAKLRGDLLVSDFVTTYLEVNYSSPRYAQGDNANAFGKLDSITGAGNQFGQSLTHYSNP